MEWKAKLVLFTTTAAFRNSARTGTNRAGATRIEQDLSRVDDDENAPCWIWIAAYTTEAAAAAIITRANTLASDSRVLNNSRWALAQRDDNGVTTWLEAWQKQGGAIVRVS